MQAKLLIFSLLLLCSFVVKAERKWQAAFYNTAGMPVYGYSQTDDNSEAIRQAAAANIWNMETDGGATDHVLTKARFDAAQWYFNSQPGTIRFPGKSWFIQDVNLNIPPNITIEGDGKYYTLFTVLPWINTSFSNNVFISYGKSYITIQNLGIKTGSHKFNAVFKFNSMFQTNHDVCQGITLQNLFIDSSWCLSYIKGGESAAGDSHCIIDLNVTGCELAHGGNPAKPYNIGDGASDFDKCHAINYNQTTQGGRILNNSIHDFSGDGFNWQPGFADGTGVVPPGIGGPEIGYDTVQNTYSCLAAYNAFVNNSYVHHNLFLNPTCSGGFAVSYACANSKFEKNTIRTYEGRTAWEVYCGDCSVDFGDTKIYTGKSPDAATWKTSKNEQGQMMFTAGYNISYTGAMGYDYSLGVSPNCPDVRRGILITGHATVGLQPLVWKGKDYPNTYLFHCTLTGFTGRAICAEQLPQSDVRLYSDCRLISDRVDPWENIVGIYAPDAATGERGWYFYNPYINKTGSKLFDATHAAVGFSDIQGTVKTLSRINALRLVGDTKACNKTSQFSFITTSKISYK